MPSTKAPHERKIDRLRQAAASLHPFDYLATAALVIATAALAAVYVVGTSLDEGPKTSIDFYRSAATVIPTLLIAVAIQGRAFELSRKISFRRRYWTVLLAVVVFGGEAGALMTIARGEDQLGRPPVRLSRLDVARHCHAVHGPHRAGSLQEARQLTLSVQLREWPLPKPRLSTPVGASCGFPVPTA
jgi:hypothetical protein